MMTRTNQILGVVLAVQVLLGAVTWWPSGAASGDPRDLLGMPVDQIQTIAITGRMASDTEPVAPVVLARVGEAWTIESAEGYPAAQSLVDPLLENLGKLSSREIIASKEMSYPALEVADKAFTRKLEVTGTDGAPHTLLVGAASGKEVNVRVDGESDVYRVRGLSAFSLADNANRYFERQLLKLSADELTGVELRRPDQPPLVLEKADDGTWTAPGSPLPVVASEAKSFAASLGNLRMLEPAGKNRTPEMGFDQPIVVHLSIQDEGGATRTETYRVGSDIAGETGRVWLVLDSMPYVFKANKGSLQPSVSQDIGPLFGEPAATP
jgi:hypothetical protein